MTEQHAAGYTRITIKHRRFATPQTRRLSINPQMRPTLHQFTPPTVPNDLTTNSCADGNQCNRSLARGLYPPKAYRADGLSCQPLSTRENRDDGPKPDYNSRP